MRVAVTGAGGLLGLTLVPLWRRAGADVIPWRRADLDVTDRDAVRRSVVDARPDVVVHLAAYTDVDRAEAEAHAAMRVNGEGTANVCAVAAAFGARVLYLSTDYVFAGVTPEPIAPEAAPAPLGAYGRSKVAGERAVSALGPQGVVVRTGWMYGPGGENFVDMMRRGATERRPVTVVADQNGAPTSTRLVAEATWGLCRAGVAGLWHVMAAGPVTWFEVARAAYEDIGAPPDLVSAGTSTALGRPARRPAHSLLDCRATEARLGIPMPAWRDGVRAYLHSGAMPGIGLIGDGGA